MICDHKEDCSYHNLEKRVIFSLLYIIDDYIQLANDYVSSIGLFLLKKIYDNNNTHNTNKNNSKV